MINNVLGIPQFHAPGPNLEAPAFLAAEGRSPLEIAVFTLVGLLWVFPFCMFAVAWHRVILLGPEAARPSLRPSWQGRHWRYLGYFLLITLISYAFLLPIFGGAVLAVMSGRGEDYAALLMALAMTWGPVSVLFFIPYVFMRLSLTLGAVSVDERCRLRDSWRQTRGQGLRLYASAALVAIPMFVFMGIFSRAVPAIVFAISPELATRPAMEALDSALLLFSFAIWMVSFIGLALIATLISHAFRSITGWAPSSSKVAEIR